MFERSRPVDEAAGVVGKNPPAAFTSATRVIPRLLDIPEAYCDLWRNKRVLRNLLHSQSGSSHPPP